MWTRTGPTRTRISIAGFYAFNVQCVYCVLDCVCTECGTSYYKCPTSGLCVKWRLYCDGKCDCLPDCSDEDSRRCQVPGGQNADSLKGQSIVADSIGQSCWDDKIIMHICISLYTCANVICIKLLLTYLLTYLETCLIMYVFMNIFIHQENSVATKRNKLN